MSKQIKSGLRSQGELIFLQRRAQMRAAALQYREHIAPRPGYLPSNFKYTTHMAVVSLQLAISYRDMPRELSGLFKVFPLLRSRRLIILFRMGGLRPRRRVVFEQSI